MNSQRQRAPVEFTETASVSIKHGYSCAPKLRPAGRDLVQVVKIVRGMSETLSQKPLGTAVSECFGCHHYGMPQGVFPGIFGSPKTWQNSPHAAGLTLQM